MIVVPGAAGSVVRGHRPRKRHGPARRRRPRRPQPDADRDRRGAADAVQVPAHRRIAQSRRDRRRAPRARRAKPTTAATSSPRSTRQTGIRIRVISGTEEARLIHLAAGYGVDIGATHRGRRRHRRRQRRDHARHGRPHLTLGRSFKLGVIRLTERFVKSDPLAGGDERRLVKHLNREMGAYLDQIAGTGFDRVIGTSGTILSLGSLALDRRTASRPRICATGASAPRRCTGCASSSSHRTLEERLQTAGHGSAARRSRRWPASVLLRHDPPPARRRRVHAVRPRAARRARPRLHPAQQRRASARSSATPTSGAAASIELGERCDYWSEHAQQVARLALQLFDQTRSVHGLADREREWLEYGALLHDIGVHISYERHHRHSYYLIKNGDLRGFDPQEIEVIGARRALPPAGDAEEIARGLRRAARSAAPDRQDALGAWCGSPKASTAATRRRSPASTSIRAATTTWRRAARHGRRRARALGRAPPRRAARASARQADPLRGRRRRRTADHKDATTHAEQPDDAAHAYPGKLFVVEGIDGSGKTTQLALLAKWLTRRRPPRCSSPSGTRRRWSRPRPRPGKKKNSLTPMTFSLLHATDFADRLLYKIIPPLKAGMIVLADRYAYTAFARDVARGVDRHWVRELYSFAVRPDLARLLPRADRGLARPPARPPREAQVLRSRAWTWAGAPTPVESFRIFQGKVLEEYDRIVRRVRASSVVDAQRQHHRAAADVPQARLAAPGDRGPDMTSSTSCLTRARTAASQPGQLLRPRPALPADRRTIPGKIIAIEGTDGVGRSTQIRLLREWLEVQGYGVIETGWTRSRADAADDRAGQVEQHAQQADVRAALRLATSPTGSRRRSSRRSRPASSCCRSLHLHGDRARRRARRRSASGSAASTASPSRRTWSSTSRST